MIRKLLIILLMFFVNTCYCEDIASILKQAGYTEQSKIQVYYLNLPITGDDFDKNLRFWIFCKQNCEIEKILVRLSLSMLKTPQKYVHGLGGHISQGQGEPVVNSEYLLDYAPRIRYYKDLAEGDNEDVEYYPSELYAEDRDTGDFSIRMSVHPGESKTECFNYREDLVHDNSAIIDEKSFQPTDYATVCKVALLGSGNKKESGWLGSDVGQIMSWVERTRVKKIYPKNK